MNPLQHILLKSPVYLVIFIPNFWTEAESRSYILMIRSASIGSFTGLFLFGVFNQVLSYGNTERYSITIQDLLRGASHS